MIYSSLLVWDSGSFVKTMGCLIGRGMNAPVFSEDFLLDEIAYPLLETERKLGTEELTKKQSDSNRNGQTVTRNKY
jgi:hypothetical protein